MSWKVVLASFVHESEHFFQLCSPKSALEGLLFGTTAVFMSFMVSMLGEFPSLPGGVLGSEVHAKVSHCILKFRVLQQ